MREITSSRPRSWFLWLIVLALTATGFCLRLLFVLRVNPHTDEYVSILAASMVLQKGWPVLPSGLPYVHGLLFTYLDAAFMALLGPGLTTARLPSLLLGTLTIPLLYAVGQRLFDSPAAGLLAATALTFAPNAIIWGGRARMYALTQFFVILAIFAAYKGVIEADRFRYRLLFWLICFCAVITHFSTITLLPPMVLGLLIAGWVRRPPGERPFDPVPFGPAQGKPWFLRRRVVIEVVIAAGLIYLAFFLKRLEQPVGLPAYQVATEARSASGLLEPIISQIQSRVQITLDWESAFQPFIEYFRSGNRRHWTQLGLLGVALLAGLAAARRLDEDAMAAIFLYVAMGGTVLELAILFQAHSRDARYNFFFLPMLFLVAGWAAAKAGSLLRQGLQAVLKRPLPGQRLAGVSTWAAVIGLVYLSWPAARPPLNRSELGKDGAYLYVRDHWQDGDRIMTDDPTASYHYLNRCNLYAVQGDREDRFTIEKSPGQWVDRWIGAPVVDTSEKVVAALASGGRVWFVADFFSLRTAYEPFFAQQIMANVDFVHTDTGVFVFVSQPDPRPIAEEPPRPAQGNLDDQVRLVGYDVSDDPARPGQSVRLTLYWQGIQRMAHDYTVFVHLRNAANQTVAQSDHRPLDPVFPTHVWPTGDTLVRDTSELSIPADTPPGEYKLLVGMYLLETLERAPVVDDASGENAVTLGAITVMD